MREELVNGSHLQNLPVMMVRYAPRDLQTVAIPVTLETIGAMAIEFGVEIQRTNMGPMIQPKFERRGDTSSGFLQRSLYLSEWLVELDGEVHIFPQDVMWNTFSQAQEPAHEMRLLDSEGAVMTREEFRENLGAALPNDGPMEPTGFLNLPVELTADRKLPDLPA